MSSARATNLLTAVCAEGLHSCSELGTLDSGAASCATNDPDYNICCTSYENSTGHVGSGTFNCCDGDPTSNTTTTTCASGTPYEYFGTGTTALYNDTDPFPYVCIADGDRGLDYVNGMTPDCPTVTTRGLLEEKTE